MELTISDERIRAAAKTCPQARQVLEVLFPEVFAPKDQWVWPGVIVCPQGNETERYLVTCVGQRQYRLISLLTGNRWSDDNLSISKDGSKLCLPKEFTIETKTQSWPYSS